MACTPCEARARRLAASNTVARTSAGIEFVVAKDGAYSDPFLSYNEAAVYANEHGGQIRSRAVV